MRRRWSRNPAKSRCDLTLRLPFELDATTTHAGELEDMIVAETDNARQRNAMMRAVSLPGRAAVMRDLAQAAKTWVGLERQAFGIVEGKAGEKPVSSEPATAAELWAELIAEAQEFGYPTPVHPSHQLAAPDAPRVAGVANLRRRGAGSIK